MAALSLGGAQRHRIDLVRDRTSLLRKVFDKTILHMAEVGTIALHGGSTAGLTEDQKRNLLWQGEVLHVSFSFLDGTDLPDAPGADATADERITINLRGVPRDDWERFTLLCHQAEGKTAVQKIWEMIQAYNREHRQG